VRATGTFGSFDAAQTTANGARIGSEGQITAQRSSATATSAAIDILSGNTPTFAVLGTGETRIGGNVAGAAPNITLNADGSGLFQGNLQVGDYDPNAANTTDTGVFSFASGSIWLNSVSPTSPIINIREGNNQNFTVYSEGTTLIGGTLPSSPNITLNAGGSGVFDVGDGTFNIGSNGGFTSVDLRTSGGLVVVSLTSNANCFKTGGGSWSASASAARLKDVVGDVDNDQAWSLLRDIDVKRYWFKTETERTGVPWMGLIAEEAVALDSELKIVTNETDEQGEIWSYNLSVLQMKSMAALSAALPRIESLEAKVTQLEGGS